MSRRYATQQQAADRFGCSVRTIRNWISEGLITGFRTPAGRAIRVDLDEIEGMLRTIPTVRQRINRQPFGPKARIVNTSEPVVVFREPVAADEEVAR